MSAVTLSVLAFASAALAQAPIRAGSAPAAPGSYVEVIADGAWIEAEGVDGGALGVRSRGGYALHEAFEIGGGCGWRAHWLSAADVGSFARVGLVPWVVWVGTGFEWEGGGFGARAFTSMGPRLVGDAQLDTGGEAWSLGLALAAVQTWPFLEGRVDARVAWLNRAAPSVGWDVAIRAVIGDSDAPVRPAVMVELLGSNDLGVSPRAQLGVWIRTERTFGVRVMAYATLPDDREGFRVGLELALLLARQPARPSQVRELDED